MDEIPSSSVRGATGGSEFQLPAELRDRIGQMVMVGFRGLNERDAAPTIRNIANGSIGAVVLFDDDTEVDGHRNIQSREQLRDLVAALKAAGRIPVLVTTDAEGGTYHRLRQEHGFAPATSAAEMGKRDDLAFTRAAGRTIAAELADVGIDMNLAPVLDLMIQANNPVTGRQRGFSQDPAVVAAHAREFILAHHDLGVLTTAKHFPGMGGALRNYSSDVGELIERWTPDELAPYRTLIGAGLIDAILVARTTYPELDSEYPACLSSKIIDGLLRREMGFDGVVISDAMEMAAIWDRFGFQRGTILAVNAGVDLLLYGNYSYSVPYSDERGPEAVQIILDAVSRGEIKESRVNESCGRILALKASRPAYAHKSAG